MNKKEQKEYEELKVLQMLVSDYNIRLRVHLWQRDALKKEHDALLRKINKALEKAKKEEENVPEL